MVNETYPLDYSKGSASPGKEQLDGTADAATNTAKKVAQGADEIAGKVAEQVREYSDKAQAAFDNVKPFIDKAMKEQPLATLGVVAAIAFVVGALWKK